MSKDNLSVGGSLNNILDKILKGNTCNNKKKWNHKEISLREKIYKENRGVSPNFLNVTSGTT